MSHPFKFMSRLKKHWIGLGRQAGEAFNEADQVDHCAQRIVDFVGHGGSDIGYKVTKFGLGREVDTA